MSKLLSYYFIFYSNLYWRIKPEYQDITTDLPEVTDQHFHIILHRVHLAMCGIRTHNIIGDMYCVHLCCKSYYHTTTATMTPLVFDLCLVNQNACTEI